MKGLRTLAAVLYGLTIYGFIYLPVAVLVLFSFQSTPSGIRLSKQAWWMFRPTIRPT